MPHNDATELGSYLRQTSVSRAFTTISIDIYIYHSVVRQTFQLRK